MQALRNFFRNPTISLVEICKSLEEINQIHAQLLVNGFVNDPELVSKFAASIAFKHPRHLDYAVQVLHQCDNPTLFALNAMIRAYSKTSTPEEGFHFYRRMVDSKEKPDNYTFTFLIKSCAQLIVVKELGLAVHGTVIKYGLDQDRHIQSGLINMYAEMGLLGSSKHLFVEIHEADLVTQTSMVAACAKLGDVVFAQELFDKMPERDVIGWNAMIAGYVRLGEPLKALEFFSIMESSGLNVNESSMVSVVSACTQIGALDTAVWAHKYIQRKRLRISLNLGSALVNMYSKCGDINKAMEVFWRLKEKNVYTWSCAMGGLAMNGYGEKCLELYRLMKQENVKPNEVTFTSVLKGCVVAGLVEEGCKHFKSMEKDFGIKPNLEHYGCMVDLYGRCGRLDEALNFVYSMPLTPHAQAWGALLNACKMHNNVELAELASRKLVEIESENDGAYVQLSNVYADFKKWDSVTDVRHKMRAKSVTKIPGVSVIDNR